MGKIVFLGDLHGNMVATLAMAEEIKKIQPDIVWFMGDAIGKGPENDKTCDWVKANCHRYLAGNWDRLLSKSFKVRKYPADEFYWNQIGKERFDWLDSLPLEDSIWISGYRFRLIHGRPVDQLYFDNDSMEKFIGGLTSADGKTEYSGLISADCHMPYVRSTTKGYVMNTGSVGNSLGVNNAHALLIEGDIDSKIKSTIKMTVLGVPYDNEMAVKIAQANKDLPLWESYVNEIRTGKYSR